MKDTHLEIVSMTLLKTKNRELLDLLIVLILAVIFSIFSVSIHFIDRLYSFFYAYTSLPIAEFLINLVCLSLTGLLWLTYRRWREAAKKQEELEDIIESISPDVLMVVDPDSNIIMCNPSVKRMFGYKVDEVTNQKTDILYFDRRSEPNQRHETFDMLEREGFHVGLATGKKKNSETIPLEIIAGNLSDRRGAVLLLRDITERKKAEEYLRLLSSAIEQSTEGMAVSNLEGNLLFANKAFATMHDYSSEELTSKHLSIFHTPEQMPSVEAANRQIRETGEFSGEIWHARRDGTVFPTLMHNSLLRDKAGNPIGMIGTLRDITERKKAEEEIKRLYEETKAMADRDPLTGLFNHRRINELLENEIERAKRKTDIFSVMMVDVDHLKLINDTYGHVVGDKLLRNVATVLKDSSRSVDSIGRYGGDEFLMILPHTDGEKAKSLVERISKRMKQRELEVDEEISIPIRLSMGIATYPFDSMVARELVSLADRGMYESKRSERNAVSAQQ